MIEAIRLTEELLSQCLMYNTPIFVTLHASGQYNMDDKRLDNGYVMVPTREGTVRANCGEWIIKGVKDELYPCKNDIFLATYEAVAVEESVTTLRAAMLNPPNAPGLLNNEADRDNVVSED